MDIVVTGSRYATDRRAVEFVLERILFRKIHVGDALGVDSFAWDWAKQIEKMRQRYEADWDTFGRAAGPKRNRAMLQFAMEQSRGVLVLVAFPGGVGTRNCTEQAILMGIGVWKVGWKL